MIQIYKFISKISMFLIVLTIINCFITVSYVREGNAPWAAFCGFCVGWTIAYVWGDILRQMDKRIVELEKEIKEAL